MKHLKKFENFYLPQDVESTHEEDGKMRSGISSDTRDSEVDYESGKMPGEEEEEEEITQPPHFKEEEEITPSHFEEDYFESKKSKAKSVSYKKSGLKRPDLADRNKNKKIEGWEKAVATKIEQSMAKKKKKK